MAFWLLLCVTETTLTDSQMKSLTPANVIYWSCRFLILYGYGAVKAQFDADSRCVERILEA